MRESFRIPSSRNQIDMALKENAKKHNKLTEEIEKLYLELENPELSRAEKSKITRHREKLISKRKLVEEEHHRILTERGVM